MKTSTATQATIPVVDLDALLEVADEFAGAGAYSKPSRATQKARWALWERLCAEGGWDDPLHAPFEAFVNIFTYRLKDGSRPAPNYIHSIIAAITQIYVENGVTPPHRLPENIGLWRELKRGYARQAADSPKKTKGDRPDSSGSVIPMMREDVIQLLSSPEPWTAGTLIRKAAILTALDKIVPLYRICRITTDDVTIGSGFVTVAGVTAYCDHDSRVQGVPWDCTACAIRDAYVHVAPGGFMFTTPGRNFSHDAWAYLRRWLPTLGDEGLDVWTEAGNRRAVALLALFNETGLGRGVTNAGLRRVRARAWLAVSWACGLRMGSDLTAVTRGQVVPDPEGRGWGITLSSTKDDPGARKGVSRFFTWPSDDAAVAVAPLLAEYMCVRDALVGSDPEGAFITDITKVRRVSTPLETANGVAYRDITWLTTHAGVDTPFTPYSTRKGYAAQCEADGRNLEDIQAGLRHSSLGITIRHYMPKKDGRAVATKAVAAFHAIEETA